MKLGTARLLAITAALALALAACGGEDDDGGGNGGNGGQDTGSADVGTPDTGSADTGTADTGTADTGSPDTGSTDTGGTDAGDPGANDFGTFTFTRVYSGCPTSTCEDGVSVSIQGDPQIAKIQLGSANSQPLQPADVTRLDNELFTEAIEARFHDNSWDCTAAEAGAEEQYVFETRLYDAEVGFATRRSVDVTGCMAADSTEGDAAVVVDIHTLLTELRDQYFAE